MTATLRLFVFFFLALAVSAPAVVEAQSFSPGPLLVVVDSTGAEVGHLLEKWNAVVIANGLPVSIQVERQRLTSWSGYRLYFTQPGCTGDAYLWAREFEGTPLAPGAMGPTGMLFVAEYGSPLQITSLSYYNYDHQTCYGQTIVLNNALTAIPSVNLETMFVPPFSVIPGSSVLQAGFPMPELSLPSAALLILVLCCIGFFRLRSTS